MGWYTLAMQFTIQPRHLRNLKETLLVITVLYFYGLAFALYFRRPTFDLDQPVFFLTMCMLFLCAMSLEAVLAWWDHSARIWWSIFAVVAYGLIGLVIAPALFGSWIFPYALLLPLILTLYGGIAVSISSLAAKFLLREPGLTRLELNRSLRELPGWKLVDGRLHKTFEFGDFFEALNFVNQIGALAEQRQQFPWLHISQNRVAVRFISRHTPAVTNNDLHMAHQIDAL